MVFGKKAVYFVAILAVLFTLCTDEVECRRKILRGRKTLNRTYFHKMALPAWAIVILVGLGEIIVGAGLYVGLKKFILDKPLTGLYHVTPIEPSQPLTSEPNGSSIA